MFTTICIPSMIEPIQSTLEPLSRCLRFAVETGNEFAFTNSVYYLLKCFGSGKNLKVLIDEVFICVRQFGCHLGNNSSFKTPVYNLFLQFFFTPLYNVLRGLEESNELSQDCQEISFPFDHVQLVDNYSVLKTAINLERFNFVLMILTVQTPYEFMTRNMESALKCSSMYFEHFFVGVSRACSLVIFSITRAMKPLYLLSTLIYSKKFQTGQANIDAKWISP
jgi:hypothetical protein